MLRDYGMSMEQHFHFVSQSSKQLETIDSGCNWKTVTVSIMYHVPVPWYFASIGHGININWKIHYSCQTHKMFVISMISLSFSLCARRSSDIETQDFDVRYVLVHFYSCRRLIFICVAVAICQLAECFIVYCTVEMFKLSTCYVHKFTCAHSPIKFHCGYMVLVAGRHRNRVIVDRLLCGNFKCLPSCAWYTHIHTPHNEFVPTRSWLLRRYT